MSEILQWETGLNGYKKHTLHDNHFTTELTECQFEVGRNIDSIFLDHLSDRKKNGIELLYSGGVDSELVLIFCLKNKIPVNVITMVIQAKGITLNTSDLYYAEKFCREHDIKQNLFYLDAEHFFKSEKYLDYLLPYNITEPHVASHFWLIDQCHSFPVFGGDWPWYQKHKNILSPFKLAYSSYDRYMHANNISGIGNMISHSFESAYRFIELQNEHDNEIVPILKQRMYNMHEPRLRSYGWEQCPKHIFNISNYKLELLKRLGVPKSNIVWGNMISTLIGSSVNSNLLFS